jgi:hypothetical protein
MFWITSVDAIPPISPMQAQIFLNGPIVHD